MFKLIAGYHYLLEPRGDYLYRLSNTFKAEIYGTACTAPLQIDKVIPHYPFRVSLRIVKGSTTPAQAAFNGILQQVIGRRFISGQCISISVQPVQHFAVKQHVD